MLHHRLIYKFPDPLEVYFIEPLALLFLHSFYFFGNEGPIVKLILSLICESTYFYQVILVSLAETRHVLVQVWLNRQAALDLFILGR